MRQDNREITRESGTHEPAARSVSFAQRVSRHWGAAAVVGLLCIVGVGLKIAGYDINPFKGRDSSSLLRLKTPALAQEAVRLGRPYFVMSATEEVTSDDKLIGKDRWRTTTVNMSYTILALEDISSQTSVFREEYEAAPGTSVRRMMGSSQETVVERSENHVVYDLHFDLKKGAVRTISTAAIMTTKLPLSQMIVAHGSEGFATGATPKWVPTSAKPWAPGGVWEFKNDRDVIGQVNVNIHQSGYTPVDPKTGRQLPQAQIDVVLNKLKRDFSQSFVLVDAVGRSDHSVRAARQGPGSIVSRVELHKFLPGRRLACLFTR